MDDAREGGCQCGAVRYRVEGEASALYACHCTECQRQSGSAFGMSWIVPADRFRLLSGDLKTFSRSCDSGRTLDCRFCPDCGTRIYHQRRDVAQALSLKAGTLDDTSGLVPGHHIWTRSRQPWLPLPESARRFETEPV